MNFKHLLYAMLAAALPLVYTLLVGKFPDFPIDVEGFVGLILWVIGLLIGGWQLKVGRLKR